MLKQADQMVVEMREKMRGGAGTIKIKHIFTPDELTGKVRLMAEVTIPTAGSIGFHTHEGEEEVYYILSGEGEVEDQGRIEKVRVGDAVLTGNGAGHAIKNTGSGPLIMLATILLYA